MKTTIKIFLIVVAMSFCSIASAFGSDDFYTSSSWQDREHYGYNNFYGRADGNHYIHEPDGSHRRVSISTGSSSSRGSTFGNRSRYF